MAGLDIVGRVCSHGFGLAAVAERPKGRRQSGLRCSANRDATLAKAQRRSCFNTGTGDASARVGRSPRDQDREAQ
jgi:hypothetical protein